MEDPDSHILFPAEIQPLGARSPHRCVGVGTRSVTIFGLYVYSVGLYVREDDVWRVLQPADAAAADILTPAFLARLASPAVERSIVLSPYRTAAFSHLRDGFAKAAETRWARMPMTEQQRAQAAEELVRFKTIFPKGSLAVGDRLLIACKGDTLRVFHNDQLLGEIESAPLATTLFLAYLDASPVSPPARAAAARGLAQLVRERFPQQQ